MAGERIKSASHPETLVVLVFIGHYLPAYKSGGPVRTIANVVDQLGDEFRFLVFTRDRDALDDGPYDGVPIDHWTTVGNAQVYYASTRGRSFRSVARVLRETPYDILYLNSYFDWSFTIVPLIVRLLRAAPQKPLVIAPRGEFSSGALALKAIKKRAYMFVARAVALYRGATWQASSAYEAQDIKREMGRFAERIAVAPDLPGQHIPPRPLEQQRTPGAPLRVVFVSRISPMKNLDYALRVLASVEVPVTFSIYGSVFDEGYWSACSSLADQLPSHVCVRYEGLLQQADVIPTLCQHDLFFLPTKGENYGHVIHEALVAGLPVLISDQTPWRGLAVSGVGWDLSLEDPDGFLRVIQAQYELSADERSAQIARSQAYASEVSQDRETVDQNRALFKLAYGSFTE